MCGRFTLTADQQMLKAYLDAGYDIKDVPDFDVPRYNIAPSQQIISLLSDGHDYRVGTLKWGFIPPFAKDDAFSIINAKSETLDTKPAFKSSFLSKRCVVLADGFYEWQTKDGQKHPFYIYLKDHSIFAMAAIWHTHQSSSGLKHHTVAIVTTHANEMMSSIHDRMPVMLNHKDVYDWLNPSIKDVHLLKSLLKPYDTKGMQHHEVSSYVNTFKHDDPSCIVPVKT